MTLASVPVHLLCNRAQSLSALPLNTPSFFMLLTFPRWTTLRYLNDLWITLRHLKDFGPHWGNSRTFGQHQDLLTTLRYSQGLYAHRYIVTGGGGTCGQGDYSPPLPNADCLYSLSEWCTFSPSKLASLYPNDVTCIMSPAIWDNLTFYHFLLEVTPICGDVCCFSL